MKSATNTQAAALLPATSTYLLYNNYLPSTAIGFNNQPMEGLSPAIFTPTQESKDHCNQR